MDAQKAGMKRDENHPRANFEKMQPGKLKTPLTRWVTHLKKLAKERQNYTFRYRQRSDHFWR
jgi:gluconate kinase